MRQDEGVVRVLWTRAELIALREAVEITPNFEGRQEAREILRVAVRAPRMTELTLDADLAERLSGRLVPVDLATATARAKLLRAVHGADRRRTVPERWRNAAAPAPAPTARRRRDLGPLLRSRPSVEGRDIPRSRSLVTPSGCAVPRTD